MTVEQLEVFADVRCPFTHVGLRRIVAQRNALGRDRPRLWVRAWPLELVNGEPLSVDLVSAEIEALRAEVAPDLFRSFAASTFAGTSLPALALASRAYAVSVDVGEAVSLDLRDEAFEAGRDVGDRDVIAAVAQRHGVGAPTARDHERVLGDWREGQQRGVVGSPYFIVDETGFFCPALSIAHGEDGFRVRLDEAGLADFFAAVFGP